MTAPTDFWNLRASAVTHAQNASREKWTDYNIHDPGIMMIEAFCFAVTELEYRAEMPMADILCRPSGQLDLKQLGLERPEAIFRGRPVSADDLIRILTAPGSPIAQAYIHEDKSDGALGLTNLYVVPTSTLNEEREKTACDFAKTVYYENRLLCEDLGEVKAARARDCVITIAAEIEDSADPTELAVKIVIQARKLLINRDADAVREAVTLENAFADPMYHIRSSRLQDNTIRSTTFHAGINNISEIVSIERLDISTESENGLTNAFDYALGFDEYFNLVSELSSAPKGGNPEENPCSSNIILSRAGRTYKKRLSDILNLLSSAGPTCKHSNPDLNQWIIPEAGTFRDMRHEPLLSLLPPVFAAPSISRQGDGYAGLHGYLSLMDALLDDAHTEAASLSKLFSVDLFAKTTYPSKSKVDKGRILPIDPAIERKHRVLDYLLALYGEEFDQAALRDLHTNPTPSGLERDLLKAKLRLLRELPSIHVDMAFGPCLDKISGPSRHSGFARKLQLLLNLSDVNQTRLDEELKRLFHLSSDGNRQKLSTNDHVPANDEALPDPLPDNAIEIRYREPDAVTIFMTYLCYLGEIPFLNEDEIGLDVVYAAVDLANYKLIPLTTGKLHLILILKVGGAYHLDCGIFDDREEAEQKISAVALLLSDALKKATDANVDRFYVIEDILLRENNEGSGYDPMLVHLIWPIKTPNDPDQDFRRFVEVTAARIAPAHIITRCHWLDKDRTHRFETAHARWLRTLRVGLDEEGQCKPEISVTESLKIRDILRTNR